MDEQLLEKAQWGRLPFDLFLLGKWDPDSTEETRTQAARLARGYVESGVRGRAPYLVAISQGRFASPTPAQIDTILKPIQSVKERNITAIMSDNFIWLRTCYDSGSDARHADFISSLSQSIAEITCGKTDEEYMLNDSSLHDFDKEWTRIFTRLPDLVSIPEVDPDCFDQCIRDSRAEAIREWVDDEVEDLDYEEFLSAHVAGRFFVEDRDTLFGDGRVLLLWLDDQGRVIKENRLDTDEGLYEVAGLSFMQTIYECGIPWCGGDLGNAYMHGGECALFPEREAWMSY